MNARAPSRGLPARRLRIWAPAEGLENPAPVGIRVIGDGGSDNSVLPALWSRPRCGQDTRRTVALAPRQSVFTSRWPSNKRKDEYDC